MKGKTMTGIRKFCAIVAAMLGMLASGMSFAFPIAAPGTEGFEVIVTSTNDIIATYQGNSAAFSNDLYLDDPVNGLGIIFNNHASLVGSTVNLGAFAVGTTLIFRLHVNDTGDDFYTGAASRNPDGLAHARVQSGWMPNETLISFEDLFGTPEGVNGFNDLSFSFTNVAGVPAIPEPETYAMLVAGLGLLGFAARRRKQHAA